MLTLHSDLHYGLLEYPSLHGANAQVWSPAGGFTAPVGRVTKKRKEESFLALPTLYIYYIKDFLNFQISRVNGYHICITRVIPGLRAQQDVPADAGVNVTI